MLRAASELVYIKFWSPFFIKWTVLAVLTVFNVFSVPPQRKLGRRRQKIWEPQPTNKKNLVISIFGRFV